MSTRNGRQSGLAYEGKLASTPTVSSLALLKVSYDRQHKDYFENFVSIVAECVRQSAENVISLPELQSDLRDQFGLVVPQNAIRTVLKRAKRQDYVRLENGVYYRNTEKLDQLGFRDEQRQVMEEHDSLIKEFIGFCSQRFNVSLSPEDADAALQLYLEKNQV